MDKITRGLRQRTTRLVHKRRVRNFVAPVKKSNKEKAEDIFSPKFLKKFRECGSPFRKERNLKPGTRLVDYRVAMKDQVLDQEELDMMETIEEILEQYDERYDTEEFDTVYSALEAGIVFHTDEGYLGVK